MRSGDIFFIICMIHEETNYECQFLSMGFVDWPFDCCNSWPNVSVMRTAHPSKRLPIWPAVRDGHRDSRRHLCKYRRFWTHDDHQFSRSPTDVASPSWWAL